MRIRTKTIEVPEEIAISGNGQPAYVKMRTRYLNNILQEIINKPTLLSGKAELLYKQIEALDDTDPANEGKANKLLAELEGIYSQLSKVNVTKELLAYAVIEWNWLNEETGEPLPEPSNPEAFNLLYEDQTKWLRKQIEEIRKYKAAEGNAPSSAG